jgi:RNA polymerase sigma-70 factor (ECF subfamily)
MKGARAWEHSLGAPPLSSHSTMDIRLELPRGNEEADSRDVATVFARHGDFVWLSLQRLGIRDADVEDLLQEVFVVVNRRLDSFDGSSRMTTWLFGICVRVAAAHRRRARLRHERVRRGVPERSTPEEQSPEALAAAGEERAILADVLDTMELEERALLVMFEVDEISCEQIAEVFGVPVGTVYSRLHAARRSFHKALDRRRAREANRMARSLGGRR